MESKRSKTFPTLVKHEIQDDLDDKRTVLLFPAVFKCLMDQCKLNDQFFKPDAENGQPVFIEDKVYKFPLGLRLVCLDWNNAIEQYYQTTPFQLNTKTRFIKIHGQNATEINSQIKFLSKFGQELETLNIEVSDFYDTTMVGFYLLLQQIVNNLQKLKSLSIHYNNYGSYYKNIEQLDESISLYSCPKFENLESLYIKGSVSNQIINELLKRSSNLATLKQISPGDQFSGLDYSTNLPNLIELDIAIETNYDFQQFKQFGKNWKLKTFRGDISSLLDKDNWLDIFQVLGNSWTDSLEDLCIILPQMGHRKDFTEHILKYTQIESLNLPKLKTFEISTVTPISLDFLLPSIGTLESIQINWIKHPKELNKPTEVYLEVMDRQIVEHLGSEDEMEKSNIWGWFFNLHWVKSVGQKVNRPTKFGAPVLLLTRR